MSSTIKRTYNLSPETVATVKRLADVEHVAATQDAVVEYAIAEISRQLRDAQDAQCSRCRPSGRSVLAGSAAD